MDRSSLNPMPTVESPLTRMQLDRVDKDVGGDPTSGPEVLLYENYEQFKQILEDPQFTHKVNLAPNRDIIHRIVAETRNASVEEIEGRKKALTEIVGKHRALLNYLTDEDKRTPLHEDNVHLELLKHLIGLGAQVHSVTQTCQFTFVHVAAKYLNPDEFHELVTFLLEMELGELIKFKDFKGLTPIHTAVRRMEVKEETILVCRDSEEIQFDLNDLDVEGNNVLAYAVMGGRNEDYLNLLQRLGAVPMVNSMGYSVLHHAASFGNLDAIKLFGTGDHLYLEASGGLTPLHVALSKGQGNIHDVVATLLERCKGYLTLQDDEGQTPLWLAKNGPLKEVIEPRTVELLRKGLAAFKSRLKQAIRNDEGERAKNYANGAIHNLVSNSHDCLYEEVELKKYVIAAILRSRQELLNTKVGDEERTPLLCEKAHSTLLKFLIAKGADVTATTKSRKQTVLHLAAEYLSPEEFHELVLIVREKDREVLEAVDSNWRLALHIACYKMEVKRETLHAFQDSGADLTWVDDFGQNLLTYAVCGGKPVEFLRTLSSLGLRPVKTQSRATLVHYAARSCSLEALKYLIKLSPANVNAPDKLEQIPLHYAIFQAKIAEEHLKITHALLDEYGCKDRLKEPRMRNVIHFAVRRTSSCNPEEIERKKQIIDLFAECDDTLLNAETAYRETPLEVSQVHAELIKYLICKGCDPRHRMAFRNCTFLHVICTEQFSAEQYHDLVLFLVGNGYQEMLKMRDSEGSTPLHQAVINIELKEETIELFKAHGGLKVTCNDGWNIIFFAAEGGRSPAFVKMLMAKAALGVDDIDMKGRRNTSAVHLAARSGNLELLKFFLELNPKLANKKNFYGATPLHEAVRSVKGDMKRLDVVKLLLNDFKVKEILKQGDVQKLIELCIKGAGATKEGREEMLMIMQELIRHRSSRHIEVTS